MTADPRPGRSRGQRGTLSLELSIIAPLLLALLFLFIAFGRFGQTTGLLEQGARDSARSATQARSAEDMWTIVDEVAAQTADSLPGSCADTLRPSVSYEGEQPSFARGSFVTVTYTCNLSMSDLLLPGWTARTITRSFTSRLDPNRGVYQ